MPSTPIYKIIFFNQGQIYEIYARQIYQSDLYGFIEIEELVFGEWSTNYLLLQRSSLDIPQSGESNLRVAEIPCE